MFFYVVYSSLLNARLCSVFCSVISEEVNINIVFIQFYLCVWCTNMPACVYIFSLLSNWWTNSRTVTMTLYRCIIRALNEGMFIVYASVHAQAYSMPGKTKIIITIRLKWCHDRVPAFETTAQIISQRSYIQHKKQ